MARKWWRRRAEPERGEQSDEDERKAGSPYRQAAESEAAPASQSLTAGRVAAALLDFDYEAALAGVVDNPRAYATAQQLERQRFVHGELLLPFVLRSSTLPGIGGMLWLRALFVFGELDALVLPRRRGGPMADRQRTSSVPAVQIPSLAWLARPEVRGMLRALNDGPPTSEGLPIFELGAQIQRSLARARQQGKLRGEALSETLRALDLLLDYRGYDPNVLALPELAFDWAAIPAQWRERVLAAGSPHLHPWELGRGRVPDAIVDQGGVTRVLAYVRKHEAHWHSTGTFERISRLELRVSDEQWSLERVDLWTHTVRGTELS